MARRKYPKRRFRRLGPKPLLDHNVLVEFRRPDGSTYRRLMGGDAYRRLMARSKGGRTAQANGTAHRWTSETARKAAKKLWATRWRKVHGVRIGVPAKRRPAVDRAALRRQYSLWAGDGIPCHPWYHPTDKTWHYSDRIVSEVTALRKLGHLPSPTPAIPSRVLVRIKLIDGKPVAIAEPEKVHGT